MGLRYAPGARPQSRHLQLLGNFVSPYERMFVPREPATGFSRQYPCQGDSRGPCTCPAGQVTSHRVPMATRTDRSGRVCKTTGFRFEGAVCGACALRPRCVAARPGMGRTGRLHPHQEGLLQQARALQHSPAFAVYRRLRVTAEHRLARLTQLGMRQARCFGRAKTKCQLYLAATVANLTLVASPSGLHDRLQDDAGDAPVAATGDAHGVAQHPRLPSLLNWLRSSTLPMALCPNRASG